jgi:hypothetical protein
MAEIVAALDESRRVDLDICNRLSALLAERGSLDDTILSQLSSHRSPNHLHLHHLN